MARPLQILPMQNLSFLSIPISYFIAVVLVLSIFSMVSFLCMSRKTKKPDRKKDACDQESVTSYASEKRILSKINSDIREKAHSMVKMISWRKVAQDEEEEDDEAIWRKTIMMGERCRPLDFSGKILYDSQGNLLSADNNHIKIASFEKS